MLNKQINIYENEKQKGDAREYAMHESGIAMW